MQMKQLTILVAFIFISVPLYAQSFNEGIDLFENGEFEEAIEVFASLDDERSQLFAAKSFFNLHQYQPALRHLKPLQQSSDRTIRQEAIYTNALTQFRLRNYAQSLDLIYELLSEESRTGIQVDARRFYRQLMNYLTLEERFKVQRQTNYLQVAKDLAISGRDRLDDSSYQILVREILKMAPDSAAYHSAKEELLAETELQPLFSAFPSAPQGMVYNIGIILPTFGEESPEFTIPRNLYFGITHAAEEFNTRNADKKVKLHFKPSGQNPDTTAAAFTELVWSYNADAVIGPLFSDPAKKMAQLAEEFRVPMLAPLANADDINIDYNYTFQINPTFEMHGKNMARFAVRELGLDSLAVITQANALGTASALGFRHEAERLGAHISYYFEEDFAAIGYNIADYTEVFTSDEELADSLGFRPTQGIYAPFTGQAARTLINLLLTDIEVLGSDLVIMGSEEWEDANISNWQMRNMEIYYTKAFAEAADSATVAFITEDFESRFGIEADQFAKIGFDTANYLFQNLERAGNPAYLKKALKESSAYDGLAVRIDFDDKRVNQHVFFRPLSNPAKDRMNDSQRLRRFLE